MSEEEPRTERYLEHAREMNEAARLALRLNTRDASSVQAKISLGLSLQAAELAGKGMLRAMGMSPEEIRTEHKGHDVLHLLLDVESQLAESDDKQYNRHQDFLNWRPTIDDVPYEGTVKEYLSSHFERGKIAFPRNYFYPDHEEFTGPDPIQVVYVMVEHIVDTLEEMTKM